MKNNLKSILRSIFPIFSVLKSSIEDLKGFNFWDSTIGWAIKLYALTLVIPICGTIMITFSAILGVEMRFGFFEGIWEMWSGFYITGTFLEIAAWRWQLMLFSLSFFINITNKH